MSDREPGPALTPNAENRYRVSRADLPVCCPMPGMSLWNSHPKIYLSLDDTGRAKCGYCGAEYYLEEDDGPPDRTAAGPGDAHGA